jgi:hypothetical protein
MRKLVLTCALTFCLVLPAGAAASPVFNLDVHHNPTNFTPGGDQVEAFPEVLTAVQGSEGSNEKQAFKFRATSGTFTLSFDPDGEGPLPADPPSAPLPLGASGAAVQGALESLPSIAPGDVSVAAGVESQEVDKVAYNVEFQGALAATDVAPLIVADGPQPLAIDPEYWIDLTNVGPDPTSGPITLTVNLPAGITRRYVDLHSNEVPAELAWSCPGSVGDNTIVCTTSSVLPRHILNRNLKIKVLVDPSKVPEGALRTLSAKISSSGAAEATAKETTPISSTPAPFGIIPSSFVPDFFESDGLTPQREAGAHPDLLTVPFDLNSVDFPGHPYLGLDTKRPSGNIRNVHVDAPPGFIGNPSAVGECPQAALTLGSCPPSSQVGRIEVMTWPPVGTVGDYHTFNRPVFNLQHPRGAVSDLAFVIAANPVHIRASLDPANRYAITTHVPDINETVPPFDQKLTLWGVPAEHSHDSERCDAGTIYNIVIDKDCPTDFDPRPFLALPSQCEADNVWRLHHYDSWQESGKFGPEIDFTTPGLMEDCDKPRFEPTVEIEPTGKQANTPTGLDVHVKIAQNENPNALATPPVQRFTVRLPLGMSFSPSFADGLKSCTLAQMQLGNNDPVQCPDASRIGEVRLHTPLLLKEAEGSMYLAAQHDNPYGSTFALLLVIHDTEERGTLIKIPGRIEVDPNTGQITTVFQDTPQFPFDDLTLKFRSGPRAPLVSPPSCGTQTIGVEVASYARPAEPVDVSNHYEVTEGPNGTPCPPDSARRPFHPAFTGGTLNPVAGHYSTFLFRMTRTDDEQELSQVSAILPPGLVARLAGTSLCPDGAINSISTDEGAAAAEVANPACPASSFFGSVSAGLGAGPGPNYFPGKAYLAGPYKGAPLSLAVVAPGIAGPFDLGNVVVRTALYVNPETSQVRAVSDPFPTILHGVILRARDIRLRLDKPETTINPTNCSMMSLGGHISGVGASLLTTADDFPFDTSTPFQVGSCGDLSFKPKLSFHLFGGTHRGSHPKFQATLRMPPGGANISSASVALPHSEFLDQSHIGTVCTRPQFAQEACPAASIYGTVTAKTPLLEETLHGNLYLRSSSNPLPDLVAAFRGGRIDANVVGRIDSVNGGIRNTFDTVPDVPVTTATFSFYGGKKGLLVNSRDICKGTPKAKAVFAAHNGAKVTLHPLLKSACGKAKKAKGKKRPHRQR